MSELQRQQEAYSAAHARLWGKPTREQAVKPSRSLFIDRRQMPGQLPRNGTTMFYHKPRAAVDFAFAMELVCEDRGLTPDQMLNSPYCAAVAARHMLWTVMLDGGYSVADIARKFAVDHKTVTLGIVSFREFRLGAVGA